MAGAARKKIDPQTAQLFDPEVDKPDHDRILTTLFADDDRLLTMLRRLHGLQMLEQPTDELSVEIWQDEKSAYSKRLSVVKWKEAVALAGGVAPKWTTLSPIRNMRKFLEHALYLQTSNQSSRIMGFIDMVLTYEFVEPMYLVRNHSGKTKWGTVRQISHAMVEVKSQWPTAGNLLRQLNLYRQCNSPSSHGHQVRVVVGPDDSMNEILGAHGWRLAYFNDDLSSLRLAPEVKKKLVMKTTSSETEF